MEEWVTVATFAQPADAHIVKAKLESEGIDVFVADEHLLGVQPLYSAALGGAKIQVRKSEVEKARQILEADSSDELNHLSEVICPSCNSREVSVERKKMPIAFFAMLFFFLPFPIFRTQWKCSSCGYQWRGR